MQCLYTVYISRVRHSPLYLLWTLIEITLILIVKHAYFLVIVSNGLLTNVMIKLQYFKMMTIKSHHLLN